MKEINIEKNTLIPIPENIQSNQTFSKLKRIQNLLKQESTLKQLCKYIYFIVYIVIKERDEIGKQIEKQCKEMYMEKIKLMNNLLRKKDQQNSKKLILLDKPSEVLEDLNYYLPSFMFYLWENPEIMALLLKNVELNQIKSNLAHLVMNNFYENILSSDFIQNNLIYVITILLKEEIDGLSNVEQKMKFLENTCCGYLLEELRKKMDVQIFFKNIIADSIENLERKCSDLKLSFNVKEIAINYKKEFKSKKTNDIIKNDDIYLNSSLENIEESNNYRNRKIIKSEQINFNSKYIPLLNKVSFENYIEKNKIDKEKSMYNLYSFQLNNLKINQILYTNQQLINNLNEYKESEKLLYIYQHNFTRIINFIDSIIENILNNFHSLPYSIKCFCKIISLLVVKKFPSIKESEKIIFISNFFFKRLLIPILRNIKLDVLTEDIISENTCHNMKIICDILNKFVSGELFNSDNKINNNYAPFNWYFIEKSEKIYKIIKHTTKVTLPKFIEDYINDKLPIDFKYDYFQQNKNEVINFRSICFNIREADILINAMDNCKSHIFDSSENEVMKKALNKLLSQTIKEKIVDIITKENNLENGFLIVNNSGNDNQIESKQKIFYFLITSLITNNEYKNIFELSQSTKSFSIKEIKDLSNEININQNNIIKVKNFICNLLYYFNKLDKNNFETDIDLNTKKILEVLNILTKSWYFKIDGSIPFDWYINSFFEYLPKIPENLTKNDCEELYNEIERDINSSISQLDFPKLGVILERFNYVERQKLFYNKKIKLLSDIQLKEKIQKIICEEFIPVTIKFKWNDDNTGIFQIESSNFERKDMNNIKIVKKLESSKKLILACNIESFTRKFPNLNLYQKYQDVDIFEIQKILKFPTILGKYFDIVFSHLEFNYDFIKKHNRIDIIKENIFDYVMSKLYDKIFPIEPNQKDNIIFQRTVNLSWTKPEHFLGNKKQFVFGSFMKDIQKLIKDVEFEKSPRKKILNIYKISNEISFFYAFNGNAEIGLDEIISLLNYGIINIQPYSLNSNLIYMKLYRKVGSFKFDENKLELLEAVIDFISDIKYTNLQGITEQEFLRNLKAK